MQNVSEIGPEMARLLRNGYFLSDTSYRFLFGSPSVSLSLADLFARMLSKIQSTPEATHRVQGCPSQRIFCLRHVRQALNVFSAPAGLEGFGRLCDGGRA